MAVNDVQDQNLTNGIESLPPKLRNIKSHPYLNTYSTPPLPKTLPKHFHQLSDQTGQQTSKFHHNHQSSLPQQLSHQIKTTNPFQTAFKTELSNLNQSNHQIDKQPIYLNGNIEQYETTFNYGDLDKNESLYINQPINRLKSDDLKLNSSDNSFKKVSDLMNEGQFSHINGYSNSNQLNNQLNRQLNHLNSQMNYQNHLKNGQFNHIENQQKGYPNFLENQNIIQSTYHGLPVKFVKALKKLFDIFDTNKCGLIRIVDIESRINDEEFDEELDRPQDLIDSLRKVTSPNGLINFSNFCAAINICLLKNQLNKNKQQERLKIKSKNERNDSYIRAQNLDKNAGFSINGHLNGHFNGNHKYLKQQQSSINSNSPLENSSFTSTNSASSSNSSSRIHKDLMRMNSKTNQNSQTLSKLQTLKYRPSSVPVEFNGDEDQTVYFKNNQSCLINKKLDNRTKSMGNLKEQIYANRLRLCSSESRIQHSSIVSPQEIMERLFEWRNNLLERKLRSMNIGNNGLQQFNQIAPNPQLNHLYSIVQKKTVKPKRDEMRRHTVNIVQSNGLETLNTAKKLMNMRKEKELLQKGLIIIERAKNYYLRQIAIAQNQIDALNQYSNGSNFFFNQLNNDYNIKQHLDKLNNLEQINRNLALLIDDQLPQNKLNGLQPEIEIQKQNLTILKLKEQIQQLTDDLIRKTNLISNLEKANPFLKIHS